MTLYTLVRWNQPLYKFLYKLYYYNHENKFIHQKVSLWLKWIDKFFIVIPIIFILRSVYPKNKLLVVLVDETVLNSLFSLFSHNSYLFTSVSVFLFLFAILYRNTYKIYENEERLVWSFHSVNHRYRNFVNKLLQYKKDNGLFEESLMGDHKSVLEREYYALASTLCNEAQRQMAKIINDNDSYIAIKFLVDEDEVSYKLVHNEAYPNFSPDRHLSDLLLAKRSVPRPSNLFQVIINKFNNLEGQPFQSWGLGIMCNDLKGEKRFDKNLIKGVFSRYKASIIIPITIESALSGFFCYNTKRVGMLREKHVHFLSGYCDNIANIYRNIIME